MTKLLREDHRPDGMSVLTLDLNGVQVIHVTIPTILRSQVGDDVLDKMAAHVAENAHVLRNDPPRPVT